MTDEEFIDIEIHFAAELAAFIDTCNAFGVDPKDRIDDILLKHGIDFKD